MKTGALVLLGLFLPTPLCAAEEVLHVKYKIENDFGVGSSVQDAAYYVSDKAMRMEMRLHDSPVGETVVISKPGEQPALLLFPGSKTFTKVPQAQEVAGKAVHDAGDVAESRVPFKATGERRTVAGYKCNVVARSVKGRNEEACVSKDLLGEFRLMEGLMPKGEAAKGANMPRGLDGFPLFYRSVMKDGSMSMTVAGIERRKMDPSLFEVPKGYKETKMPIFDADAMKAMMDEAGNEGGQIPKDLLRQMESMMEQLGPGPKEER